VAEMRLTLMRLINDREDQNDNPYHHRRFRYEKVQKERKENKVVSMKRATDKRVHLQTGFPSLIAMLGYISILCGGDINEIKLSSSTLPWFEEWYVFFEFLHGRSSPRWADMADKYNLSEVTLRKVFNKKIKLALTARQQWPSYVSMLEDELFRKENRWEAYNGRRVVMYDNTNIKMNQPSCAEAQRATYSLYYSGNVGKGAVYVQPCGWIGCNDIWSGAVSDSYYMQHSDVFPMLNNYLRSCSNETDVTRNIPFTIILDRGYRITLDAMRMGGHFVLQPIFANTADQQFTTEENHVSSTVATDRAGNERAVKYEKISHKIKYGLQTNQSSERLCDMWLVWGFQTNFMY
jgi:hypothetical protein